MLIDVSSGTVCQSHEKKCWTDTGDQCCQNLENKNFKKVRESIAKAISGVYISKKCSFPVIKCKRLPMASQWAKLKNFQNEYILLLRSAHWHSTSIWTDSHRHTKSVQTPSLFKLSFSFLCNVASCQLLISFFAHPPGLVQALPLLRCYISVLLNRNITFLTQ